MSKLASGDEERQADNGAQVEGIHCGIGRMARRLDSAKLSLILSKKRGLCTKLSMAMANQHLRRTSRCQLYFLGRFSPKQILFWLDHSNRADML